MNKKHTQELSNIIKKWVENKPNIKCVYIYGSFLIEGKEPSDIDIAVEFYNSPFSPPVANWFGDSNSLSSELQQLLKELKWLKCPLHLELFNQDVTPYIEKGLSKGNIKIYERDKEDQ